MTVKYSIVIPTRNRAEYLPYAIKSVLDSQRKDIELIVSNNFSSDTTQEILSKITDPRLKVVSPHVILPMAGHYEFAIAQASGEWITIMGDDDAVMPYIFESLDEHIKKYPQIDIISSARSYYFWEGCEDIYGDTVVNYTASQKSKVCFTKKDLMYVIKGLKSCFDMPQIYTTCVVRSALYLQIKDKSGGLFYHSISPDIDSIISLCLAREKYLRVNEPLFWVGTSNKSMGLSNRVVKEAEKFKSGPKRKYASVPTRISKNISDILYSSKLCPIYILESLMQNPLTDDFFKKKKIKNLVLSATLNISQKRERNEKNLLINEILKECNRYGISKKSLYLLAFNLKITGWFLKFLKFISIKNYLKWLNLLPKHYRLISNDRSKFPTILDASDTIIDLLKKNKL